MESLVSIITPLYNAHDYFDETATSVLNQTYQNWEWVIVDDCSSDDSFEIAKKYALKDERIKLQKLDKNSGSAFARNKALDIAKGKYITFLDADDLLDKCYLAKQVTFIKENGPIVSAGYMRMSENKTPFYVPNTVDYKTILKGNPLSCLTTMYDREVFPDARFDCDMEKHEDYLFWIKILKSGYIAIGNPEILATYRLTNNSKNSSKIKLVKPLYDLYRKKLGFNFVKSFIMVIRYIAYSRKKYKGVKRNNGK